MGIRVREGNMSNTKDKKTVGQNAAIPPAAQRALAEAQARRAAAEAQEQSNPQKPEVNGPKGEEPTRFGDWERGGRCVDF